jgi:hypothetical protein
MEAVKRLILMANKPVLSCSIETIAPGDIQEVAARVATRRVWECCG